MARPLLRVLRTAWPSAARVAVGPAAVLELLAGEDPALEYHAWPAAGADRARLAASLRVQSADIALVLPPSFSSAWFALASGARRRIGFAADLRSPLLTTALPRVPRGDLHLAEEYLALGSAAGVAAAVGRDALAPLEPLFLGAAHHEAAARRLAAAGVNAAAFAILAPGATYGPAKRWAPERFARVGDALRSRGLAVLLCGEAGDAPFAAEVARQMRAPATDLCGRTALGEVAALAARAQVVVSNDSGFAHLAAATGAPTVAIFGSTSSAWTAPLGARVRIVQQAPVCAPCFRRTCAIGYRCLLAIEAAEVERAAREIAA